jgi:uncharacterized protein YukE
MLTANQLLQADPSQIKYVSGVYRSAAASIATRCDDLDRVIRGLAASWTGSAQAGAVAALSGVRSRLLDVSLSLTSADQALAEFAETVAVAQNGMASMQLGGVGRALRMADAADADVTRRLGAITGWFDGANPPAYVPGRGTDPATVFAWWSRLTPAEQRFMIKSQSLDVTQLDGIPVDARDQAARLLLHTERDSLTRLSATTMPGATAKRVHDELGGLESISNRLDDPFAKSRQYLLSIDALDDRAVIALGDPDRTTSVVTVVSGVGSGVVKADASLDAMDNLTSAATARARGFDDVATVSWLDYDAPTDLQHAASVAPAAGAGSDLARFDEGLRMTHLNKPAHDTVVGHSYGSTVVGMAATSHSFTADDVVFVGSPGVGVDQAADLGMNPTHVWATMAADDPIRFAVDPVARAEAAVTGQSSAAMWFGTAPTAPEFGGETFASSSGNMLNPLAAHLSYFDERARSLANIADIAVGRPPDE